ncbi:MAG TPA: hypothetical protein VGM73_06600 [Candidatus Didemnitutus sp.]|jgi:hypothetical protein
MTAKPNNAVDPAPEFAWPELPDLTVESPSILKPIALEPPLVHVRDPVKPVFGLPHLRTDYSRSALEIPAKTIAGLSDIFGSPDNLRRVMAAGVVSVARLPGSPSGGPRNSYSEGFDSDRTREVATNGLSPSVTLTAADGARLVSLLSRDNSYDWTDAPLAPPLFLYRVRFAGCDSDFALDLAFNDSVLRTARGSEAIAFANYRPVMAPVAAVLFRYFPELSDQFARFDESRDPTTVRDLNWPIEDQQRCHFLADLVRRQMLRASRLELIGITQGYDGDPRPKLDDRWDITGQDATGSRAEIESLASALSDDIERPQRGFALGCFDPHHALRWSVDGESYTAVICFHCIAGYIVTSKGVAWFPIAGTAATAFNEIFGHHGLPVVKP